MPIVNGAKTFNDKNSSTCIDFMCTISALSRINYICTICCDLNKLSTLQKEIEISTSELNSFLTKIVSFVVKQRKMWSYITTQSNTVCHHLCPEHIKQLLQILWSIWLACNYTVSQKKKLYQCYFLNNSVKPWPTVIIFCTQHQKET